MLYLAWNITYSNCYDDCRLLFRKHNTVNYIIRWPPMYSSCVHVVGSFAQKTRQFQRDTLFYFCFCTVVYCFHNSKVITNAVFLKLTLNVPQCGTNFRKSSNNAICSSTLVYHHFNSKVSHYAFLIKSTLVLFP